MQNAADRLGVVRPSSVVGSADIQVRQLFALANQEGKELARRYPWQAIQAEKTFTATATETQSGAIPSDFDRFLDGTFYNRTQKRRVYGPLSPQEYQDQQALTTNLIFDGFRQRGDSLLMIPTPTAGDSYAFEYVSKNWCQSSGGTGQAAWAADGDTGVLDEELMTDGVVWRFKKAKGLDYSEEFRTYEAHIMMAMSRDGGKRTVNMSYGSPDYRPHVNFPDGSWNVTEVG